MQIYKIRYFIFLREVIVISWTSFGGPQAHLAHFIRIFCHKRAYLSESALLEIYALCQILPGPSSTQTITGIAYRLGGASLAYLTLFFWVFPSIFITTLAAIFVNHLEQQQIDLSFARFTQAIAVGFIISAAVQITPKVIQSKLSAILVVFSTVVAYFYHPQWFLPLLIIFGGIITTRNFEKYPQTTEKQLKIRWRNLTYFILIFLILAFFSEFTRRYEFGLPFRLAENFYRTGSIIFGGGHVLVPLMLTEFVYIKKLISREEFDLGYNFNQILPGPTFAFSAFIGAMAMREFGVWGQVLGAILASFGVFTPGTLLIFFVMQFWDELKKYRPVRAALEGIHAVSLGLVLAAVLLMGQTLFEQNSISEIILDVGISILTFLILHFTKIPPPFVVLLGLLLGFIL